ncbi:hypothetical protein ACIQGZ_03330 [Streptomyces sp. NPDC092296]|uniref:hypothetical protein n=1 Tax=Streptomyces sp. NPDC092296 TaxID=3366012 RepID=UPI00381AEF19
MRRALLSLRAAVVLLSGTLTGVGAGVLTALGGTAPARSVLYGVGAFGLAVPFFDWLVAGRDDPREETREDERAS